MPPIVESLRPFGRRLVNGGSFDDAGIWRSRAGKAVPGPRPNTGASEELSEGSEPRGCRALGGQVLRFAVVGIAGFLVDTGLTLVLAQTGVPPWSARPPAIAVAVVLTWAMNRGFTFRVDAPVRTLIPYALVAAGAALLNYGLFLVAVEGGLSIVASIAAATAVSMIVSFLGYRRLAFGLRLHDDRIQSR